MITLIIRIAGPIRSIWVIAVAGAITLTLPIGSEPALATPAKCPGPAPKVRILLRGQGTLESVIVDRKGRLFFTNEDSLLRLDAPGAQPRALGAPITDPGGLALDSDGMLIVGYGNTAANGSVGDQTGPSGLLRVNPDTGSRRVYATGLSMANGLDRGPDGSFYSSNDFGSNIDRIRNGRTERGWSHVESGNGLVVDTTGRYLYVVQTFRPAAVQRIETAHPERVTPYVIADTADMAAGLDGLTRDARDRLFAAANGAGEIWRVDRPPRICLLLGDLAPFPDGPSNVATGKGTRFPAANLYVVTFGGDVLELVDVAAVSPAKSPAAKRARIRLRVLPRRVRRGDRRLFRFRATAVQRGRRRSVRGVRIRFAGRLARTDRRGRARISASFSRPALRRARARRGGYRTGRARVRVLRAFPR